MEMTYIGIDPGLDGAIAKLTAGVMNVRDMPTVSNGNGREYDLDALGLYGNVTFTTLLARKWTYAAIELVHSMPGQGVRSMFTMGYGYGQLVAALHFGGIPYEKVTPQAWKKELMAGMPKEKSASYIVASRLFPGVEFKGSRGGIKTGRCDAALLAEYARRRYQK